MKKTNMIIIIALLFVGNFILYSQPLIAPDTVFIQPAYYNSKFEDIGISKLFTLKINNKTGVEILSTDSDLNLSTENKGDKTLINVLPILDIYNNGNILLEEGSTYTMKAILFYNSPKSNRYETNLYINYKTIENDFQIDTVHIIANRINKDIYTKNQKLLRGVCENSSEPELFTIYSSLLNGSNGYIQIDSIGYRIGNKYKVLGYSYKEYEYDIPPSQRGITLPIKFREPYYTVKLEITDTTQKDKDIYIDYYTDKGLFVDTISIGYSKMTGITAKTFIQNLESKNYQPVESKYLAVRMCSNKGYRIKSINLVGEFDINELNLNEYYKVGDIIAGSYVELSKFTIKPDHIPNERSGAYIYELENLEQGNVITIGFPFTLEIDPPTNIASFNSPKSCIYPNPTTDIINISKKIKVINVELIDPIGKIIQLKTNNHTLDIRNINKGIYFIKISTQNKEIVEKLIIR